MKGETKETILVALGVLLFFGTVVLVGIIFYTDEVSAEAKLKAIEEGRTAGIGEKYAVTQDGKCIVKVEGYLNTYCLIDSCPDGGPIAFTNPTVCGTLDEVLEAVEKTVKTKT
jgi:hypothetical protein